MKKIAVAVAALVILIGAGGFWLFCNLDHIIQQTVIKYASAATQADVGLDSVHIGLTSGDGQLSGLSVGNPKGFSTPKAFYLGSIAIKLDTSTIRGTGPIVIKQVVVDKPQITYELLNNGDSNLQALQNNTQAYANSLAGKKTSPPTKGATVKADPDKSQPGRKIIISDFVIRGGQVSISQAMLKGKELSVPLPDIHMTSIGKSSGGATAAQVVQQTFGAIANGAAKASVVQLAKDKINGVINAVPVGAIGGAASDTIGNGIKDVFGQ